MYVKEAKWYLKQQRRRNRNRRLGAGMMVFSGMLLVWLCFLRFYQENGSYWKDWTMEEVGMQLHRQMFGGLNKESIEEGPVGGEGMVQRMKEVTKTSTESIGTSVDVVEKAESEGEVTEIEDILLETEKLYSDIVRTEGKYLIVLDAGHGGEDEGCSFEQVEEKMINLQLVYLLKEKLEALDFQVLLTREEDVQLGLEERVRMANGVGADAFISIHQNACEEETATGIETYYYASQLVDNERLARLAEQYLVLYTKGRDRGVREAENLYVIRETNMPACLVETGFLSNPTERELLQQKKYQEKIAQGLADAVQLYFYPKSMYLTFDDGPVAGNTDKVLDILQEKGIKATFFVVGKNVERNPQLVKRIVEEGHTIGIHCYQHDYEQLYDSVESYLEDFEKARQVVYEVTGVEAKLFRFPGGSINSYNKKVYREIIKELTAQGYVYFDWNASCEDAVRGITAEKILQNAKESTLGRKKVVMLAHDMVDVTVEYLEELLEMFPEYKMLPITEEVEPVQF